MTLQGFVLGLLNIGLIVLVCAIIVGLIVWALGYFGVPFPPLVIKLLWGIVALIAVILLVQLLFGIVPPIRIGHA